ncbi:hypothetical protein KFK09_021638 [Dendrobium nobile]|uniref:Uncharacterized protein n=1 Tax=Dendrobium nobile TaxID=94219 RepID=A0A8T3AQH6_DENNO|nr:hypothetical protein KFK09_021638 [Dendrobium nobile]
MVQTLQLKTTKNPYPYKISWVKKRIDIAVTEMCRLYFSIGKHYMCEVLCDVVDMDVCHLILGRPWKFDVGAIYDGRANTYSLEWKAKKLRLLSQPSDNSWDSKEKSALQLVTGSALLNAWKESSTMLVLVVAEPNENFSLKKVPEAVHHLLQRYQEILSETLQSILPPLRALQHQIDFIPDSVLPNLPHYKINPTEQTIMQQMVDLLLEKQLIQPSLSLCAVSALLVPKKDGKWRLCMDSRQSIRLL